MYRIACRVFGWWKLTAILVQGALAFGPEAEAQQQASRPGKYAEVNGITLYFEIHGAGRPLVLTVFRRNGYYPDILRQQEQVSAALAVRMKQTPMYRLCRSIAPRVEDWPRLLDKMGQAMKQEFDWSKPVADITAPVLVVAGDADIFPPSHAVELFGLLGGGQRDPGWDGSGRPQSQLAILPGLTH